MAIVTPELFSDYINNYEEATASLRDLYLDTSQRIVEEFLGYKLDVCRHEGYYSGIGDWKLYLDNRPIRAIDAVFINGKEIDPDEIGYHDDYIFFLDRRKMFPNGVDNVFVSYIAGFDSDNDAPSAIKTTVLRIAALLATEADGNIGITSQSFGDQNRNFYQFTSFQKYLEPLQSYRLVRF